MPNIQIGFDETNNEFILSGDTSDLLSFRRAKIFLNDFLHAKISKDNFIKIPFDANNQDNTITKIQDLLEKFGFSSNKSESAASYLQDFLNEENNFKNFSQEASEIRNNNLSKLHKQKLSDFTATINKEFPTRRLYPLQLLSSFHLAFSQNSCNFSVPGAGKTSIVYAAYAYLKSLNKNNPKYVEKLMIIGPLSSFGPWENEYRECFNREPSSIRLSGGLPKKEKLNHLYASNPAEISLISYNSVPNIEKDIIIFLKKFRTMVVLDEAHKIKNTSGGVNAEAILRIAKFCSSRVVLTGTPAPNGYEDIYNLFRFIWPNKNIIQFHLFQLKEMSEIPGDSRVKILTKNISSFFMRIRKSDLKIPEATNLEPIYISMGKIQREIYGYIEKNYMDFFQSAQQSQNLRTKLSQARLIRLMQASTNPALLKKPITDFFDEEIIDENFIDDAEILNKILKYEQFEIPPKFVKAKEIITQLISKGEKVIVWAIFIQNIIDFQKYLSGEGIESETLYGATPIEQEDLDPTIKTREQIISEFHSPKGHFNVIIANPFAVAESISLHKVCHNAIYLERSFNAGQFIQSKDRIHRYGLKPNDKTFYYYLLSDNNTDYTIHQRLNEKEKRMLEIIENEQIPLFSRIDFDDEDDFKSLIMNYVNRSSVS
jgi:hypothetical protein